MAGSPNPSTRTVGNLWWLLICMLVGCSDTTPVQTTGTPRTSVAVPDFSFPAFEGRLYGMDGGEWGGKLVFQGPDGRQRVLLEENVHGIVRNSAGVFVFTGLAHMGVNDGYIYIVAPDSAGEVQVTRLGRLPGAPSRVVQSADGATAFLVHTDGVRGSAPFECYELVGRTVTRGYGCLPPDPLFP
jgi:hypothetical protein